MEEGYEENTRRKDYIRSLEILKVAKNLEMKIPVWGTKGPIIITKKHNDEEIEFMQERKDGKGFLIVTTSDLIQKGKMWEVGETRTIIDVNLEYAIGFEEEIDIYKKHIKNLAN